MNRTSAVTLFCRNNCITFVRFRLIGEFMDFSSQILHFVFLHYAIQAEKARFRVTAAVTPPCENIFYFPGGCTLIRSEQSENTLTEPQ